MERSVGGVDAPAKANYCAIVTPSARGAIAVVALSGPDVESVIDLNFKPASRKPFQLKQGEVVYGIWRPTSEDIVVCGIDSESVEIHCHGGVAASTAIVESLEGFRAISPYSYAETKMHPWAVSCQKALSESSTEKTALHLAEQCHVLPLKIDSIIRQIESGETAEALEQVQSLLDWSSFGMGLTQPRSVVLCGKPNVGKSSLINELVGFQRAIVHDQPGTTRDVLIHSTAFDGWPVTLKDTAGLRVTDEVIEKEGIKRAIAEIESADVVIQVMDVTTDLSTESWDFDVEPDIILRNKCDLLEELPDDNLLNVSAVTKAGIPELVEQIGKVLVESVPNLEQPIPVNEEQVERLTDCKRLLLDEDHPRAAQVLTDRFFPID